MRLEWWYLVEWWSKFCHDFEDQIRKLKLAEVLKLSFALDFEEKKCCKDYISAVFVLLISAFHGPLLAEYL